MQLHQIGAITLRHFRHFLGDSNILFQMLFWPVLDTLVWGYIGLWIQGLHDASGNMQLIVLFSVFLLRASSNAGVLTGLSLYEELASNNLINLFASPLRLCNWLTGVYIFSSIVAFCILIFYVGPLNWFIIGGSYHMLFYILKCLLIFVFPMILCGLCLGTLAASAVITFGKRANELLHVIVWGAAPFTTAYYPLEVLPLWAQTISNCLPFAYILQAMREFVLYGANPIMGITKGLCLACVYGALCVYVFYRAFKRSKVQGLARLSD